MIAKMSTCQIDKPAIILFYQTLYISQQFGMTRMCDTYIAVLRQEWCEMIL